MECDCYINLPVPKHLRNAPTKLAKQMGHGEGYLYPHDHPDAVTDMECLPPSLAGKTFYEPTDRGVESRIAERLDAIRKRRRQHRSSKEER